MEDGCLNSEKLSSHAYTIHTYMRFILRCDSTSEYLWYFWNLICFFFRLFSFCFCVLASKTGVWIHLTEDG